MKKIVLILLPFLLIMGLVFLLFYKQQNKKIDKVVKKIESNIKNKISVKIKTINYNKNRGFEHFTNISNILFKDKSLNLKITKGGIIKNGTINRFFNPNNFKDITKFENKIFIGYKNGFLMLSENNINFFDFSKDIKKCIKKDNNLYCISEKELINSKKELDIFYSKKKYKSKIKDIEVFNNKVLLLFNKHIIIIGKDKDKKIELTTTINNFVKTKNLYLLSDREIYLFKNEKIKKVLEITGVNNIIEKNGINYYISFDGIVYKDNKKIVKIDSIINNSFLLNDKIYLLTPKGIYTVENDKLVEKIDKVKGVLQQNFITKFYKYDSRIFIGFFNKGVSIYDSFKRDISDFILNLNGINDIKVIKNKLYIATTNALEVYDFTGNKIDSFSKKAGLLGRNISSIEIVNDKIYLGTEGGVSKKTDNSFISIYGLNGLINNRVNCLKRYKDFLYVGTLGGISKLKDLKVLKNFGVRDFKAPWVSALEVASDKLFIGTYGAGLYFYDNKKIKRISKKRVFINPNAIISYKNFIFAGSLNKGILVYNIKTKDSYFYDEISSMNITAFHIENDNLFVGSDFGFWIMPLNILTRYK